MKIFSENKKFWRQYIISGIIASFGALIIFSKNEISFENFIVFGLPLTWFSILILGLCFGIFINWEKE